LSEARPISDQPLEDSAPDGSPLRRCLERAASGITAGMIHPVTCFVAFTALILGAFILPTQGIGLSMCALKTTAGIPCPGCGLTRSVTGVFHGRFLAAWQYNPFGYGFALFFALAGPLLLLPSRLRARLIQKLSPYDMHVFIVLIAFLTLFIVYGVVRAFLVQLGAPAFRWWREPEEVPPAARSQVTSLQPWPEPAEQK
jgi:hypothetical protein